MIKCNKCSRSMFVDRIYSSQTFLEVYCIMCGTRKFYNPPQDSEEGRWLLKQELLRAKTTISPL
jgi:hypothetical protein